MSSGEFLARWGGTCAECGLFMRKNSMIRYNDYDELVHGDCDYAACLDDEDWVEVEVE